MSRAARMMFLMSGNSNNTMRTDYMTENKFRDNRGREHYENGRYAPRSQYEGYGNNYAESYSNYTNESPSAYRMATAPAPIYRYNGEGDGSFRGEYDDGGMTRRLIGFGGTESRYEGPKRGGEMENRNSQKERGYSNSDVCPPFSREMAEEWTRKMRNADGSKGPHYTMEHAAAVAKQMGIKHDPYEWWAVLNAMYTDFFTVAKHQGMEKNIEFFAALADAWLNDEDAGDNKAAKYFCKVVKH